MTTSILFSLANFSIVLSRYVKLKFKIWAGTRFCRLILRRRNLIIIIHTSAYVSTYNYGIILSIFLPSNFLDVPTLENGWKHFNWLAFQYK